MDQAKPGKKNRKVKKRRKAKNRRRTCVKKSSTR